MTKIPDAKDAKKLQREAQRTALAPDGLPWPEGYFERVPPKQTLEEAIAIHGIRPSHYAFGWPGYTVEEMALPGFKSLPPPESPELETEWRKECDKWDAKQKKKNGTHPK